jgi:hypothetical protein
VHQAARQRQHTSPPAVLLVVVVGCGSAVLLLAAFDTRGTRRVAWRCAVCGAAATCGRCSSRDGRSSRHPERLSRGVVQLLLLVHAWHW